MYEYFILDVDGVMTDGKQYYTADGKIMKVFGPHDSDGLKQIRNKIQIKFISADHRGFDISKRRIVDDLGYILELVSEENRRLYVEQHGFNRVIFMGDGIYDADVMRYCYGIAPKSARPECKFNAKHITKTIAANGAVYDACMHVKGILNGEH